MTIVRDEWRDRAACVGSPITHFFPLELVGRPTHTKRDPYQRARPVCAACDVRRECLRDALVQEDVFGFRAGLTPDELQNIVRRRRQERVS